MPEDRLNDYLDSLTSFSHGLPYTHIAAGRGLNVEDMR
jgi:hypothetical protein